MPVICPTVLAENLKNYKLQMDRIAPFAKRVQIDLTDGDLAFGHTVDLKNIWWPHGVRADIHLMYRYPMDYIEQIHVLNPKMVIIHAEAEVDHMHFAAELHRFGILAGLCVLSETSIADVRRILHSFDHLLIFSGDLGRFGGKADLKLLHKVKEAKAIHEDIEIGWDGGVNDKNVRDLVDGGVDVLNVGGFIQKSQEPLRAYKQLSSLLS